jgi:DNA-binding MarR family transcriptional regulator
MSEESKNEILLLDRQLCFKLYQASRKMTRLYQPYLEKIGLTYPQYLAMLVLWEYDIIDFKDLSQKLDLKTGTLTPIVQKLEKSGLLSRISNPNDKRRIDVRLTEEGKKLEGEAGNVPLSMAKHLEMDRERYYKYASLLDELGELLNEAEAK